MFMTLKHGSRAVDELFYDIQCLVTRYDDATWYTFRIHRRLKPNSWYRVQAA